jgi:DNA-binding transcriptional LysR family regulator
MTESGKRPPLKGTLRLNVPISAPRFVRPRIVPGFLAAYPEIRLQVVAEESFVDVLATSSMLESVMKSDWSRT